MMHTCANKTIEPLFVLSNKIWRDYQVNQMRLSKPVINDKRSCSIQHLTHHEIPTEDSVTLRENERESELFFALCHCLI